MGDVVSDLKSYYDRITRLLEERDGTNSDIADIFQEVKSAGYVPKVLRKVIARARMDQSKVQEEDSLQDAYESALGSVGAALADICAGATWDDAAKRNGVSRATLARAAAVSKRRGNDTAALETAASPSPQHESTTLSPAKEAQPTGEPVPDIGFTKRPIDTRTAAEIMGDIPARLVRAR